ncbi:XrtA/PEP-CTERM system TPR-repeat protein PrsT [Methylocaldum szegediense]|uniref:PEP-CTERM system TPR-repeat lipoprotein n=1 Tax=Methylocaldum szegediense TaxID=73780 RepID=A0ABM9I765_9GAMM|nr:XrtA/PEP-CTERM system TPR-repeat protein PrsT [Methylocaldum szegediense]CAI8933781.1 putative PEP-CTERM system TPR-repeat lipoprotein [Methylocaldum szegediense]
MVRFFQAFLLLTATIGCNAASAEKDPLEQARNYLRKGESKAAVIELKNALQANPENADARVLLGESYLKLGDGPSAAKELEKARDLGAPKESWIVSLARAYLLQDKPKAVLDQISPDERLNDMLRAQILGIRGLAHILLKQTEQAKESFDAALKFDSKASDALLGLAMLEAQQKRYKQAIEYANQSIAADSKNVNAWIVLGETKRLSGDLQGAADAFTKALDLQPFDIRARLGRATAYLASNKADEAQKDINEVRKSAGEVPLALYLEAVIAFQKGALQEAEDALVKVTGALPDHLPSRLLLGVVAYRQGKYESAENNLAQYVRTFPEQLPAAKLLAATQMKLGRPSEAIRTLKGLEDRASDDSQFFALLGSAYLQAKQYDSATEYLNRASELAPNVASVKAQLALGRIASGQMEQAVDDLKSAVELDQNLLQADVLLVLALIQQKKLDEAVAAAEKMKGKMPGDPMPHNLLGAAYMAKGNTEKAREHWQQALRLKPDYATAALNLAKLDLSGNNPDAAAQRYQQVLKHDPKNLAAHIGLAQIAEMRKDFESVEKHLTEAREKNPKALQPAVTLSRFYLARGKALQALEVARATLSDHPDHLMALQSLGLAQMANGQEASAIATFKKLVSKVPNNPEYRHQLAQMLYKKGEKQAAVAEWEQTLQQTPDYLPALLAQAELKLREKKYDDALKIAERIKTAHPKSAAGFQVEGDIRFAQKQFKEALPAYEKAFQSAPSSILARLLFQTRRALGQDKEAFDGLTQWLESSQEDVDAWTTLAMAYQESGRLREAVEAYEKAQSLAAGSTVIQNNLAWLYQELGSDKALPLAEKLLAASENRPEVMDTVGWIFVQNGKQAEGLNLLRDAAVHAPHIGQIRIHLAEALAQMGRKDEARKELERLLKEKKNFAERDKAEALLKGL